MPRREMYSLTCRVLTRFKHHDDAAQAHRPSPNTMPPLASTSQAAKQIYGMTPSIQKCATARPGRGGIAVASWRDSIRRCRAHSSRTGAVRNARRAGAHGQPGTDGAAPPCKGCAPAFSSPSAANRGEASPFASTSFIIDTSRVLPRLCMPSLCPPTATATSTKYPAHASRTTARLIGAATSELPCGGRSARHGCTNHVRASHSSAKREPSVSRSCCGGPASATTPSCITTTRSQCMMVSRR